MGDSKNLSTLSTDSSCQLDVLGHDGDSLGVDGTQVGVFRESYEGGLRSVIPDRAGMKSFVTELLRDCLEFRNAILQEGSWQYEDGLCIF